MVYGVRELEHSERFKHLSNAQDIFMRNLQPGMWLVDAFPQLRKLPHFLQWWRPSGNQLYEYTRNAFKEYYDLMQSNIKKREHNRNASLPNSTVNPPNQHG